VLEFLVLGPLDVRGPAGTLDLGGTQQRLVLAVLLMRAGEFVGRDTLVDALWPDNPPASARHGIESIISRLRRVLREEAEFEPVIESSAAGYRLVADRHRIDRDAFEELAASAARALAAGDAARASECAERALKLWRGPAALADLSTQPALRAQAAALDERRVQVLETVAEARLALGRHADALAPLQTEAAAHPTHERVHELLMLALYRCGRQAEALETYRNLRAHLARELGLEPRLQARTLHEGILHQDPALSPPGTVPPAHPAPASTGGSADVARQFRRGPGLPSRRLLLSLAIVILVAVAVIAALSNTSRMRSARLSALSKALRAPALGIVRTSTGRLEQGFRLGLKTNRLTVGGGAVWATAFDDGKLVRIDVARGSITQTVSVGHGPTGVVAADGTVWVANTLDDSLARVDARTTTVVQRITVGDQPSDVGVGAGAVWVSNRGAGTITRVDPRTGAVKGTTRVGAHPEGIALGYGGVWVALRGASAVARLDLRTGALARLIHVGSGPTDVATDAQGVWVANQLDATVSLIDPSRNVVVLTRTVSGPPVALATDGSHAWVGARQQRSLTELDVAGHIRTTRLASPVTALAALNAGHLLVAVRGLGPRQRSRSQGNHVSPPN
jgi:DNA-binding SARP family transcriptional activator/streptogramin lyase